MRHLLWRALLGALMTLMFVGVAEAGAATLYLSSSGSDAGSCGSSTPCRTFDRAYRVASPGDVVQVAGGTYGSEAIPALGRSGPAVEFRSAAGATVTLAGLAVRADDVIVRGVRVQGWASVDSGNTADPVERVKFYDVHTSKHWLNNGRDFLWKGGSIGPSFNEKSSMIGGQPASQRLTYDGVTWHDATRNDRNVHMECFYVASVQGITVRNSRFTNCAVFDVLITRLGTDANPRDVVFENNVFERSRDIGTASAYYTVAVHSNVTLNSLVLRNNVWEQPISIGGTIQSGRAVGNIGAGGWDGGCQAGIAYSYNVLTTKACGPNDRVDANAFAQFANPAGGDWRLKAGATAIGAAHPTDHPATDAAGNARDSDPDAGAFEYGGTAGPPPDPDPDPEPEPEPEPGPDTQAPSVPQGMAWTTKTQTSIGVRWDAASDNVGVTGYRIYRNGTLAGTTTDTNYTVTGLSCNTGYTISLSAVDAAGNESNRAAATGTTSTEPCTSTQDTEAPSVPQGMAWTTKTQNSLGLRWDAARDNVGVTGYRLYVDGTLAATTTQTSHAISGLKCGTSYTVGLTAIDAAGNESNRAEATGTTSTEPCTSTQDTEAPSVPQGMAWTTKTQNSIGLRWDAARDNVGVTGYRIYRNGTLAGTTTDTSYSVGGLACGTSYTIALAAIDAAGNESNRAEATGTTSTEPCAPQDTQDPSAPQGMDWTTKTQTSLGLRWDPATDNVGVTGYRLYVHDRLVATTTQTTYTITGLQCGTSYTVALTAIDAAGNESSRPAATATTRTRPCGLLGSNSLNPPL